MSGSANETPPAEQEGAKRGAGRSQWFLLGVAGLAAAGALFLALNSEDSSVDPESPATSVAQESATPDEMDTSTSDPAEPSAGTGPTTDFEAIEAGRREEGDPKAIGKVDAPVMMVAYSEFQCPFCARFALETMPELEHYVDEGTLRVEWRDLPYLGPESDLAALAGEAAGNQNMFWEFHDALYADQPGVNSGTITKEWLSDLAEQLGLDVDAFEADLAAAATQEAVEVDKREALSIGAMGTPAFLINGRPVMGAQPTDVFEQTIDAAAAQAQR